MDAHGNPVDFLISDGVTHDSKIAPNLLSLLDLTKTEVVNADRGYDSKELRHLISATQAHPNIPKKKNSKSGNTHMDWHIYKARHVIENTFATLKHFRSIVTRFDKLKNSYTK